MIEVLMILGFVVGWCIAPFVCLIIGGLWERVFPPKLIRSGYQDPWPEYTEDVCSPYYIEPRNRVLPSVIRNTLERNTVAGA